VPDAEELGLCGARHVAHDTATDTDKISKVILAQARIMTGKANWQKVSGGRRPLDTSSSEVMSDS